MSEAPPNTIVDLSWSWRSTAAYEAELRVLVTPERRTATTEVRGRLVGPRCRYAATVEIAYPLQAVPGPQANDGPFVRRVIVPEASPWDPESPFLYTLVVELWQDGRMVDRRVRTTGLLSTSLGPRGLSVNGHSLILRGGTLGEGTATEVVRRRHEGRTLLLAPVTAMTAALWSIADEYGVFLLGLLDETDSRCLGLARSLTQYLSCFGWLIRRPLRDPPPGRLGLLTDKPAASPGISFLVVDAACVEEGIALGLPLLVRGTTEAEPPIFGTVEE
jgi:hypothetical protein